MNHVYQLCLIALVVGHALAFIVGKSGQKQIIQKKDNDPRKVPDSGKEKRAVILNLNSGSGKVLVKVHSGAKYLVKHSEHHHQPEGPVITQIGAGNKWSHNKKDNHIFQVKVGPVRLDQLFKSGNVVSGQFAVGNKWLKVLHTKGANFISKYLAIH